LSGRPGLTTPIQQKRNIKKQIEKAGNSIALDAPPQDTHLQFLPDIEIIDGREVFYVDYRENNRYVNMADVPSSSDTQSVHFNAPNSAEQNLGPITFSGANSPKPTMNPDDSGSDRLTAFANNSVSYSASSSSCSEGEVQGCSQCCGGQWVAIETLHGCLKCDPLRRGGIFPRYNWDCSDCVEYPVDFDNKCAGTRGFKNPKPNPHGECNNCYQCFEGPSYVPNHGPRPGGWHYICDEDPRNGETCEADPSSSDPSCKKCKPRNCPGGPLLPCELCESFTPPGFGVSIKRRRMYCELDYNLNPILNMRCNNGNCECDLDPSDCTGGTPDIVSTLNGGCECGCVRLASCRQTNHDFVQDANTCGCFCRFVDYGTPATYAMQSQCPRAFPTVVAALGGGCECGCTISQDDCVANGEKLDEDTCSCVEDIYFGYGLPPDLTP